VIGSDREGLRLGLGLGIWLGLGSDRRSEPDRRPEPNTVHFKKNLKEFKHFDGFQVVTIFADRTATQYCRLLA